MFEDVRLTVWGGPVGVELTEEGGIKSSELVDLSSSAWTRLRAPTAPPGYEHQIKPLSVLQNTLIGLHRHQGFFDT